VRRAREVLVCEQGGEGPPHNPHTQAVILKLAVQRHASTLPDNPTFLGNGYLLGLNP
jgi:hypothetical protein